MTPSAEPATVPSRRRGTSSSWLPAGAGLLATLIGVAGAWIPSFWWDEAATVSAADRTVPELGELLGRIDAVHGAYYLLMHGWFAVFGIGELSARVPSALAVGIATAALVQLARMLADTRVAVAAGAVFMVLPRITWAATEARSYALVAAMGALTGLVLVTALRSTRRWWWALYAVLTALSVVLFFYSAALVVAHAVTVALSPARRRYRFLVAAAAAGAAVAPFAALALSQSGQVDWVPPLDHRIGETVAVDQWFPGATGFAALCLLLVIVGGVVGLYRGRRDGTAGDVLIVALPWLLVPIALFLVYSLLVANIYLGRYLIFTTPAVALLVGLAVGRTFTSRVAVAAVLLVLALVALPDYLEQRQPWGKPGGTDYSAAADELARRARPGDCVAFQPTVTWQPTSLRAIEQARPDAFADLDDIGFGESGADLASLWDTDAPTDVVAARARHCAVVWAVTDGDRATNARYLHPANVWWEFAPFRFVDSDLYRALAVEGFVISERVPIHHTQLVRLERS
ncbi:glycosyltransferase family 39 protein [Rhodococcus sp. NPDC003318]|uniref:glycosyltransferase family 39 protein n=1 Tax=Rhodococcus sp. NPDC003318 TaxID=3364503 RepID=UPI003690A1EF